MSIVTSMTLLEKVKQNVDDESWAMFYDLYSPLVFRFARKYGCDRATSEDIVQETMCQVLRYLPEFQYERQRGKFRSYLFQIVVSCIRRRCKSRLETESLDQFGNTPQLDIPDPHPEALELEFERQRRTNLMEHAIKRVKGRIESLTWKSFECFILGNGKSAADVAAELGIDDRNIVYQHKNRVIRYLKEEIKRLEQEIGDFDDFMELTDSDYEQSAFKTLMYDPEYPNRKVRKRFKFLQNALHNHPPIPSKTAQILIVTQGNSRWETVNGSFSIGSDKSNQLQLKSEYLSKHHCSIIRNNQRWQVNDLQSTNGVVVNGDKVTEKILASGDIIQLGNIVLVFISSA